MERGKSGNVLVDPESATVDAMLNAASWMLRHVRESQGRLLMDVAEQSGVSNSVLCRIELARRVPRLQVILVVCLVLGVRFSDIMRFAEDEAFPLGSEPWTEHSAKLVAHYMNSRRPNGGGK
jgi:transcriptional regulator with XRE-family HTH domain